jgi:hypothetical protein
MYQEYNQGLRQEMLYHGQVGQVCEVCKRKYRPRSPDQRFCGAVCRYESKKLEAKSARRVWAEHGRPIINDNTDLRYRSAR